MPKYPATLPKVGINWGRQPESCYLRSTAGRSGRTTWRVAGMTRLQKWIGSGEIDSAYGIDIDPDKRVGLLRASVDRPHAVWCDLLTKLDECGWKLAPVDDFWFTIGDTDFYQLLPKDSVMATA